MLYKGGYQCRHVKKNLVAPILNISGVITFFFSPLAAVGAGETLSELRWVNWKRRAASSQIL